MPNLTLNSFYTRIWQREFTSSEYTSTVFLEDAHLIAQDIWSDIIYARKGNRNWDIWLADTVALQDEYTKPAVSSTTVGADYIHSVSVAYSGDTYTGTGGLQYKLCRQATEEEIKDWTRLLEEQSIEDPIYFEADGSLFIAPDPRATEVWTNRIRLTGARSVASGGWTTATTEQETKLPLFLLDTLYYGIAWKANEFMRREPTLIQSKFNFYESMKIKNIRKLNTEQSEIMGEREIEIDPITWE